MKKAKIVITALLSASLAFAQTRKAPARPVAKPKPPIILPIAGIQYTLPGIESAKDLEAEAHKEVEALEVTPASKRLSSDHFKALNQIIQTMKDNYVEESIRQPYGDLVYGLIDVALASTALDSASIGQKTCAMQYEAEHELTLADAGIIPSVRDSLITKQLGDRYCEDSNISHKTKELGERKEVLDKLFARVLKP